MTQEGGRCRAFIYDILRDKVLVEYVSEGLTRPQIWIACADVLRDIVLVDAVNDEELAGPQIWIACNKVLHINEGLKGPQIWIMRADAVVQSQNPSADGTLLGTRPGSFATIVAVTVRR